jgi:hypothetical protein
VGEQSESTQSHQNTNILRIHAGGLESIFWVLGGRREFFASFWLKKQEFISLKKALHCDKAISLFCVLDNLVSQLKQFHFLY